MKYIAITDTKKLILILLEYFNSVLLKNEHFNRYLEKICIDFENLYFPERPTVAAPCY